MAAQIFLEIVTPEGIQLSVDVDEFTAPSVQGEFGVLPGHLPLLAGLRTGIVRYQKGGESHAVAVGPGFAKIEHDTAHLTTDRFESKDAVDPIVARKDLKEAEEGLSRSDLTDEEKAGFIKDARWAAVRLELYGDPPPATVIVAHETRLLGHEDYSSLAQGSKGSEESGDESTDAS